VTLIEILLNAALAAADHGWPVFPLRPGSKRPALHGAEHCPRTGPCADGHRKWEQRATTDPARIRAAWGCAPYNVGLATGPAGLLVVDLDQPKGGKGGADVPDGTATFAALCERAGQPVPRTRRVRTAGGGEHLYFAAPAGVRLSNTARTLAPMVDTRAWGGYVVAAGSIVDGVPYDMNDLLDPAPLPAWLHAALTPAPRPHRPAPAASSSSGVRVGYVDAALRNEAANVAHAPEGTRNAALTRAARALGRFIATGTLPRSTAEDALKAAAEAAGLTPREYNPTINHALNWSIAHNPATTA